MLSVLQYNSYSIADNMPASENSACTELPERVPESVDPPEARPAPPDGMSLLSALPAICPAASHQLLWHWSAGSWHCPLCADHTVEHSFSRHGGG